MGGPSLYDCVCSHSSHAHFGPPSQKGPCRLCDACTRFLSRAQALLGRVAPDEKPKRWKPPPGRP